MSLRNATSRVVDDLLITVSLAGAIGMMIVAPNSVTALEKSLDKLISGKEKRREAKRIARYLKQQKLVSVTENEDGSYQVSLSDKGKTRTTKARFEQLDVPRKNWDQKWRIIMFDIPEEHKTIRDYISRHLRMLGFKQLQRSVFIYPYPVDEFVALLREFFPEVEKHVIYLTVEDTDQHNTLVKQFASILKS
jgi:phenylacetic acid degradation operon negative regulatory protein